MTLEESKEELKQLKEDLHGNGFVYGDFDKVIAIDTVLNYIENESISKEKIKKIIYPTPENYVPIEVQTSDMYSKLQELLEK